jgi:hypothetical protein
MEPKTIIARVEGPITHRLQAKKISWLYSLARRFIAGLNLPSCQKMAKNDLSSLP